MRTSSPSGETLGVVTITGAVFCGVLMPTDPPRWAFTGLVA